LHGAASAKIEDFNRKVY